MLAAQRQALLASARFGWKKPKGENAKGAESLQVWAHRPESLTGTPALVQCTSRTPSLRAAVPAGGVGWRY